MKSRNGAPEEVISSAPPQGPDDLVVLAPDPGDRTLLHAGLRPVADTLWEDRLHLRALRSGERHPITRRIDRLQLALQDAPGRRPARLEPHRRIDREQRVARARPGQRERLFVRRSVRLPTGV